LNLRATRIIADIAITVAAATVGPDTAAHAAGRHAAGNITAPRGTRGPVTVGHVTATAAVALTVSSDIMASAEVDAAGASRGIRCTDTKDSVEADSRTTHSADADLQVMDSHATVSRDVDITASGTAPSPVTVADATDSPDITALLIAVIAAGVLLRLTEVITDVEVTAFVGTGAAAGRVGRG
jgi:hypothetical protein